MAGRICDAAIVSTRAANRPLSRRTPALGERMSAYRARARSASGLRRLPRRIALAINPQKKPRTKKPRPRRLFLRMTADAMNPPTAAVMATAESRAISCVGPSDPMRHLRVIICQGRLPDPTTDIAGGALPAHVRDQSEREALAARHTRSGVCNRNQITEGAMPAVLDRQELTFP
jgi:hypothetical protein